MIIKESAENYLETILMLKNTRGHVRSVDIANEMNFTKASVSVAMKHFREEGYITTGTDGDITLTKKGLSIAERVMERHNIIAKFLMKLGVDKETAYEDSCKIEHDISDTSFEKIREFLAKETEENDTDGKI
jgi:Mn-dependent DtxR family transcriptional regulator